MVFFFKAELARLKESESSERSEWERESRRRLELEWEERKAELEAKFGAEKDAELDRIVKKLDAEAKKQKADFDAELDEKIR